MVRVDYEDLDKYENSFLATDIFIDGKVILCKSSILNQENLNIIKNYKDRIFFKFYIYSEENDKDSYDRIVQEEIRSSLLNNLNILLKYHINLNDDEIEENKELVTLLLRKICKEQFYTNYLGNIMLCNEDIFQHSIRVATLSALLSIRGKLPTQMIIDITIGALLHDIGKFKLFMKYPDLNNPNRYFSIDEYKLLQSHPVIGYEELENNMIVPVESKKIVLLHHVWEDLSFSYDNTNQDYMSYPNFYRTQKISAKLKDIGVSIVQISNLYDNLVKHVDYYLNKNITTNKNVPLYLYENDKQISGNGAGILLDSLIFKANVGDNVILTNGKKAVVLEMKEIPKQPIVRYEDGTTETLLGTDTAVKEIIYE